MKRIKYATNGQIIEHIKHQTGIDVTPYVDERSNRRALMLDTRNVKKFQLWQIAGICTGSIFLRDENQTVQLATNKWLCVAPYGIGAHIFQAVAR